MALVRAVKADPGTTRNAVIDLDLATVDGPGAAGALHAPRVGQPRGHQRTDPHDRAQPHPGRGRLGASCAPPRSASRASSIRRRWPLPAVDLEGRILRTNAPFLSLFSAVVDRDAVDRKVRLDTVIHERDRAAFAAALEKARLRQADIAPIDTLLPDNEDRHIRYLCECGRRRHGRRGRRRGGHRLCRRDDRAEGARGPDGAEPEDAGRRAAGRRHRA